jgi:hypothetical protein
MERLRDQLARTLGDLACPLRSPNPDILSPDPNSLADILRGTRGMQRYQIPGALANPFGRLPNTFSSTLTNISGATPNIASSTAPLRRRLRRSSLRRWLSRSLWWRLLRRRPALAISIRP